MEPLQSDVQGLRLRDERERVDEAVPDALPPTTTPREGVPQAMIALVVPGSEHRLLHVLEAGDEVPESFRTDRIARGQRIGTVCVRVIEVCANGCHAVVQWPWEECFGGFAFGPHIGVSMVKIEELRAVDAAN